MLKYLQLKFAEFIARVFPRQLGYGVARRLADLYFLIDRRGRECVIQNLRRIHEASGVHLSERALRALARENFLNFAKYLVDFFHFLHLEPAEVNRLVDFDGLLTAVDAAQARGHGVVMLTAHLGNWELGAAALAMKGYPFHAVALQVSNPRLNKLYWEQRTKRGLRVIPLGRAARECLVALRRNELVGIVGDRDFTSACDTVPLFGRPARLPSGPARLALATGAPILPAVLVRLPDDTYRYVVAEPVIADPGRDTVETLMQAIARRLEWLISRHSEQWFLFHDPWNIEADLQLAQKMAGGGMPARETKPRA